MIYPNFQYHSFLSHCQMECFYIRIPKLRSNRRLNKNNLHGELPKSLANMTQLAFLDLSYNNISGPLSRISAKSFNIVGNTVVCATGKDPNCRGMALMPMSVNLNGTEGKNKISQEF
ncbi:hypothetical protein Ahy_A04g018925 isoform A [Arachis hypogaea]|uniref:Leucine-rich repeat-containing N-terminal plant-type domain-containing protein n=1 Tax=Arachis hypogaea TaxID=3818 RepID=A0A445DF18_ARAHY|nr:hypothetical protein Ahy_A04g018925 isoform A [Arachis hypogaea]